MALPLGVKILFFSNFHEADTVLARKIINKANPRDQKQLGDRVIVKDSWTNKCEKVLYVGIYARFSQNLNLGQMLIATGNRQLYEATGD